VRRHPGQTLAHSSTAIPPKAGLLPGSIISENCVAPPIDWEEKSVGNKCQRYQFPLQSFTPIQENIL
jgi:hypothetical protein